MKPSEPCESASFMNAPSSSRRVSAVAGFGSAATVAGLCPTRGEMTIASSTALSHVFIGGLPTRPRFYPTIEVLVGRHRLPGLLLDYRSSKSACRSRKVQLRRENYE